MRSEAERVAELESESFSYIINPGLWVGDVCPVKRYTKATHKFEFAYLTGDGPNLYHGNMFCPDSSDWKEMFMDFKAIINAGWVVD